MGCAYPRCEYYCPNWENHDKLREDFVKEETETTKPTHIVISSGRAYPVVALTIHAAVKAFNKEHGPYTADKVLKMPNFGVCGHTIVRTVQYQESFLLASDINERVI